jgi:uncharacterized coiled-coil protein SlyX
MDERVTELEIKVSYLEKTVEELDDVVRRLNETLSAFTRELKRMRTLEVSERDAPPANEKPPHY